MYVTKCRCDSIQVVHTHHTSCKALIQLYVQCQLHKERSSDYVMGSLTSYAQDIQAMKIYETLSNQGHR
jgi:hypothetical protein